MASIWVWGGEDTFVSMLTEEDAQWGAEMFPDAIYFFAELTTED